MPLQMPDTLPNGTQINSGGIREDAQAFVCGWCKGDCGQGLHHLITYLFPDFTGIGTPSRAAYNNAYGLTVFGKPKWARFCAFPKCDATSCWDSWMVDQPKPVAFGKPATMPPDWKVKVITEC